MASNKIERIDKELFKNLTGAVYLGLNKNYVKELESNQFDYMTLLRTVDLGCNQLTILKSYTFSNSNLMEVYLEENRIDTVESKAFCNLENLHLIDFTNNKLKFLRAESFENIENLTELKEINLIGNDQIESIDVITLYNLIQMELKRFNFVKENLNIYKQIKIKGIDFFPGGFKRIAKNEFVNKLVKLAYDINFSHLFACALLLRVALHIDNEERNDEFKKCLLAYFSTYTETKKFSGFHDTNFTSYGKARMFIESYLRSLGADIIFESFLKLDCQVFPILIHFDWDIYESNMMINYLRDKKFEKFEKLLKRFVDLNKEPVKSDAYYLLVNAFFWSDVEKKETIFNFIINNATDSEKYTQNYLLELIFGLKGLFLKSDNFLKCFDYLGLRTNLDEENLEKIDIDIYKTLIYLENSTKCLIYPIARLESMKTLYFLLQDNKQIELWSEYSMDECIQENMDNISNNTLKQILDKYLALGVEKIKPLKLSVKSIESLARRNDSYLFKTFLDKTQVLNEKDSSQIEKFEIFKKNLRDSVNSCLNIAMKNDAERIAEFLLDKIIELKINDFDRPIITYATLKKMFEMKWWKEIERIFDSFESEDDQSVIEKDETCQMSDMEENVQVLVQDFSSQKTAGNSLNDKDELELDYLLGKHCFV